MAFPEASFVEANLYGQYLATSELFEFAAGTTGAIGQHTIFTVTGQIHVVIMAYCSEDLTEGGATATISVGTDGVVAGLQPVTNAVDIDSGEIWTFDTAPSDCESQASVGGAWVADDITYDVLAQTITDGELTWYCFWTPVSAGATVVAATPA